MEKPPWREESKRIPTQPLSEVAQASRQDVTWGFVSITFFSVHFVGVVFYGSRVHK